MSCCHDLKLKTLSVKCGDYFEENWHDIKILNDPDSLEIQISKMFISCMMDSSSEKRSQSQTFWIQKQFLKNTLSICTQSRVSISWRTSTLSIFGIIKGQIFSHHSFPSLLFVKGCDKYLKYFLLDPGLTCCLHIPYCSFGMMNEPLQRLNTFSSAEWIVLAQKFLDTKNEMKSLLNQWTWDVFKKKIW